LGAPFGGRTVVFLATTILASVTGFPLAPFGFDPPRVVGVISLAPTQSEPPFLAAQVALLALFVVFGSLAAIKFHPNLDARA
jgi:hypothetical protein